MILEVRIRRVPPIKPAALLLRLFGALTGAQYRFVVGDQRTEWKSLATDRLTEQQCRAAVRWDAAG